QTQDWRDEAGRETPAMQDKRVQAEDRQKAQALLNVTVIYRKRLKPNELDSRLRGNDDLLVT
ncbi:hypothetical protein GC074_11405, partial [Neisseria meningitidis]|uniref:hypothetical protein n=1 Tax=Neisseria meningitidis TaxID=487 RepID=UPI0018CA9184